MLVLKPTAVRNYLYHGDRPVFASSLELSLKSTYFHQDIQGLRGISILSLILYHAWPRLVPGGFVGVDIFFAISGFVITNTIFHDYSTGAFSITNFYRRRIRRIFPALYTMFGFTFCISWFVLTPDEYKQLGKTALSSVFFSSNIEFLKLVGYFESQARLMSMLHTRSLSVEEQFYLLYPILIILTHRYFPRSLRPALILVALSSIALSAWTLREHPSATFYLAPPRAFELLFGAIVACPGSRVTFSQRTRNGLSILGSTFIIIALAGYNQRTPFPGPAAILPCLGATLIILAGTGNGGASLAGRAISIKPLTLLGNLSYSLYLWHWPIFALARQYVGGELDNLMTFACLGAAFIASMVSLRFIEEPFLDQRLVKTPLLRMGLCAMACTSLLCLVVVKTNGLPGRFSTTSNAIFAASGDYNSRRLDCHGQEKNLIPYDRNCTFGSKYAPPDVAVWGDSHGTELVVAVGEQLGREGRSAMEITYSGCPPATGFDPVPGSHCAVHNSETLQRLIDDKRIHTVILTANYTVYGKEKLDFLFVGYRHVVDSLRTNCKRVIIVYPVPTYSFDPPSELGKRNQAGLSLVDVGIERQDFLKENERVIDFLNSLYVSGGVDRVIPEEELCDLNHCRVYDKKNGVLYYDSAHLSDTGARLIASRMPPL